MIDIGNNEIGECSFVIFVRDPTGGYRAFPTAVADVGIAILRKHEDPYDPGDPTDYAILQAYIAMESALRS